MGIYSEFSIGLCSSNAIFDDMCIYFSVFPVWKKNSWDSLCMIAGMGFEVNVVYLHCNMHQYAIIHIHRLYTIISILYCNS